MQFGSRCHWSSRNTALPYGRATARRRTLKLTPNFQVKNGMNNDNLRMFNVGNASVPRAAPSALTDEGLQSVPAMRIKEQRYPQEGRRKC
jgi:hypothetical protein